MKNLTPLAISAFTATSCMGAGNAATREALQARRSFLKPCTFMDLNLPTCIGEVPHLDDASLPEPFAAYECRNNRLARLGLDQDGFADRVRVSIERWGPQRVGLFLGSSTSGLLHTELAYRRAFFLSRKSG